MSWHDLHVQGFDVDAAGPPPGQDFVQWDPQLTSAALSASLLAGEVHENAPDHLGAKGEEMSAVAAVGLVHQRAGLDRLCGRTVPQMLPGYSAKVRIDERHQGIERSMAHVFARSGERMGAQEILAELLAKAQTGYVSPYEIAVVYAGLDDREKAFAWLNRACEEHTGFLLFVNAAPRLKPLRMDPGFQDLRRRMRYPNRQA